MEDFYVERGELYPLSLSQQNIWDIERACPDTSINNICTTLHIQGRVDFSALQRSVNLVLAADGSLRTRITLSDKTPFQYQAPFQPEPVPIYDFSQTSQEGIESWEEAFTREVMTLIDAPLYRFILLRTGENLGGLVIKMHHLISDGWTQVLLCNRIGQAYLDLLDGREPYLDTIPSYQGHVEEESKYLSSPAYERDRDYWSRVLDQAGEPSMLKSVRGAAVSPVGRRMTFSLPQDLNNDIYTFCMAHRVAPFSVFCMALAIYFKRIGGADRFTIGVPIFNRMNFAAKQTSGMYVSTLPFFNEIQGDWTLNELNERLSMGWFDLLRHQRFPFSQIQGLANSRQEGADRLFHIAFSYQNSQLLESKDATVTFSGRWHYSGYQMEQLCIHLSNLENNRRYSVDYDYLTQLFSTQEIEILHSCLVNILREALAAPDRPLHQLAVLSPSERERVLYTFNRSSKPIFETSLYGRFRRYARQSPSRAALICGGERTTYCQLEEQAARVHAALAQTCAAPDTLVAVLLPREPDLFAAMVGILRAGGAFLLLTPNQPEARIRDILAQSGAAALLSTFELGGPLANQISLIDVSRLPAPAQQPPAEYRPGGLAYVVYTSGSTGSPKGVEVCSRALLNLACAMEPIYGKGAVLSICSMGFDAFLLEGIVALLNGRTILLPREQDLQFPKALAELIVGFGVGFLCTTPSRLAAFLKHPQFQQAMAGMESVVCGGEAFPSELLQRLQLITKARVYNQYGPSETTVAVSIKQLNGSAAITAGSPMVNCKLYVLDNWFNPLPIGVYGNLYVGGVCVGKGYRNAPELTGQSFFDNPFDLGGQIYRTGDIARWTPEGEIILAGRSDRQVKLRGLRIELQEVSDCLSRHPKVRQAAAVVQRHGEQDVLLAFYSSDTPIPEEELLSLCVSYLPNYMIPSAILPLAAIPLTANGKVNEALLPRPDLSVPSDAAPETRTQELLLTLLRRVLGRPDLGLDSDYFLFGGNSLNAMEALSELSDLTGRSLRMEDLYACRTPRRLADRLDRSGPEPINCVQRLRPAPPQERWPLTPIQQGIYVQSHLDPTGRTYHMAGAFALSAPPDISRLERAFQTLIDQDPLLRTAFVSEPDGIFARVRPQADFTLPISSGAALTEAAAPLLAPFRLDQPPLLRAALWEEAPDRWILLVNLHHIIGDGLTTPLLLSRLDQLYRGETPAAQGLTYLDYAWHLAQQADQPGRLDYWKERLSPLPEALELPGDFPRTQAFDFQGDTLVHPLGQTLSRACDAFCAQRGISPYMFFLAAFGLLLSRLSGKEDLVVGAAAAGRVLPETRVLCGPFLNTLPLRLSPRQDQLLDRYLDAVRSQVAGMLDNQQVGLEEIVSSLGLKRTLSQSPLYQVIFSQRPVDAAAFTLDGAPMEYLPLPTGTARMDLWVELYQEEGRYVFQLEYAKQLFLEETVRYYGRCLETIAASMLRCDCQPLERVDALSPRDRMELIDTPNHTVYPFLNLPIPAQFARQLELDPGAPAVIFHGAVTTRWELDRRACQIANLLAGSGVVPGCRVGIALSRSVDLVAAVLAIWKVGGAYVPLLAHYPAQRLESMAEIAGITHVLCDGKTLTQLPDTLPCTLVPVSGQADDAFQAVQLKETDLAEVLFTSGSTGQPKGVMLAWRSIANMAGSFRELLSRSDGPILCTTNVVFDMFNGEVIIPLSMGKTIVMADEEEMMLPWRLAELIRRDGVKITQSTPSRVQMWLSNESFCQASSSLELMIYGGEVLTETLLRQAQTASNDAVQVNVYGPTEGTVYNTVRQADYRQYVNVGWPMRNSRLYVLDEGLRPVLPTAVGELYLAGECASMGYISRPDLTESAFLPDPFFPGERMYRTGDVARLRLDGSYDFLGRRDDQIKLNGQRVELNEINGALVSQGCALQAATVPVRRADGSMELFTYYIPTPDQPDHREIRARLGTVLPAYMIPSHLQALDAMPSTPTGKISLRTLREWAESGEQGAEKTPDTAQTPASPPVPEPPPVPDAVEEQAPQEPPPQASVPDPVWARAQPPAVPSPSVQEAPAPQPVQSAPAPDHGQGPQEGPSDAGSLEWILTLWGRILNRGDVNPDHSFFDQGGTSLAALSVLSHYHNSGLTLSLAQFYEHPAARDQAKLLRPGDDRPAPTPQEQAPLARTILTSPSQRQEDYPRHVPPLPPAPAPRSMHNVLLTGATGFFGAHVLHALLEAGAEQVMCTMRDGDRDRLTNTLSWYFGSGWTEGVRDQLQVVRADMGQPNLGLSSQEYGSLSSSIDGIWHCAADVRHYSADSEALLRANLGGTQSLIKLAAAANAPLYHMSTASVSGDRLAGREDGAVFTERDFHIGQDWRHNLYVRSKFLAEDAVFDAVRSGLNARVFRLGRLVGRNQDGTFQKNAATNAFWLTMRGIHTLGAIPASMAQIQLELTPVDWAAQAAVALRAAPLTVYHLQNQTPPAVQEVCRAVVPDLQVLPDAQFGELLDRACAELPGDLLPPLVDLWRQLTQAPPTITVDGSLTARQLEQWGFDTPISDPKRLLRAFRFPTGERLPRGGNAP